MISKNSVPGLNFSLGELPALRKWGTIGTVHVSKSEESYVVNKNLEKLNYSVFNDLSFASTETNYIKPKTKTKNNIVIFRFFHKKNYIIILAFFEII